MSERLFAHWCTPLGSPDTEHKLFSVCCCRMCHLNLRLCSFLVFPRQSSQRLTWLLTSTRAVWWTCRWTKVAPKWSGKMLDDEKELESFDTFAHVICNLPAKRLLFFSLSDIEHDCVYLTLCAVREIKAVMCLCHGQTKQNKTKRFLTLFQLSGNLCDHVQGFKMCLWATL